MDNQDGPRDHIQWRTSICRRTFLKYSGSQGVMFGTFSMMNLFNQLGQAEARSGPKPHIAVVGAGAFGGWTALYLLRSGARVTLLDAWGPGNSRASSGGETRVIRGTYGPNQPYTKMVARALQLWRENESRWSLKLFHQTGVLWLAGHDDQFERGSLPALRDAGLPIEELSSQVLVNRFPQINFDGVKWAIYEVEAGYLTARRACEAVLNGFLAEGGTYRQVLIRKPVQIRGELQGVVLSDGSRLVADIYVFACGPWLGRLFPEVVGDSIKPTRQEVFFFGTAGGDSRFSEEKLPAWIDHGDRPFYGIPNNQWRGFKLANDARGPSFDPTDGQRTPSPEGLNQARDYLSFRFPALKNAPLLESRVCQYENTPDHHFIVDRHPNADNVWLLGGGSGHAFKHGPALGEMVADLVLHHGTPDGFFRLSRLSGSRVP
jgi:monomeric sarcosine oxidase